MAKISKGVTQAKPLRRKNAEKESPSAVDERRTNQIIAEIKQGKSRAFSELMLLYQTHVINLAFRIVNDRDAAADIAQEVFVKMARNIWRYDEKKKFSTWLYRITVNAAIDYTRKQRRHRHEPLESFHESIENTQADPELTYRRQQIEDYINEAAESLNDKQRSAFILRDVEGCKIDDVADIMNMPKATVRWYLHRARAKIRKELSRRCPHLLILLGIK
jgi:RNA polymerase sigma-70 factor (ECF subfamily)